MKAISLKLPVELNQRLEAAARARGISRSEVVREALEGYLEEQDRSAPPRFSDLAGDLIGSVEGPGDLSYNAEHMRGFGQ